MTTSSMSPTLTHVSVRVLLDGQAPSGAYIASPSFSQYGFGWLRDGSYCALAMDAVGQGDSARAFHEWVAGVIRHEQASIRDLVARLERGEGPTPEQMLPTRYALDGTRESPQSDEWPNFQLDGYGTWLFAAAAHWPDGAPEEIRASMELAADYLAASWRLPCFDYWEEFGDRQHTSTLAAIAAGLRAAATMLDRPDLEEHARAVMTAVEDTCVVDGAFVKGPEDSRVDASLLSLATPFGLVDTHDARMRATVERIRRELATATGGIRRYVGDTYYGGSPWMLLTAWLGWHSRVAGDAAGFEAAREWVESRADADGLMAEQIVDEPQAPEWVEPWVRRWGAVANPLLWSHAKYLLMEYGR
ncbi:MAG: glycoside hydrolase family 15 protein [Demequina sp.]|nr:glycoside hydrolase family 15 protein [Demequina sp.]